MTAPTEAGLLRRVAEGRETDDDRAELAARLRQYLTGSRSGTTLDRTLGVTRPVGALSWWREDALHRRDAAVRALASRYQPEQPIAARAAAIHQSLTRYAASGWRLDRDFPRPPANALGTERECLFDIMRSGGIVPSERHLRRILSP